jgi:hypothetical protein
MQANRTKKRLFIFYLFIERQGEKATTHLRVGDGELLVIESVAYLLCILYF